jgi:hydroxymethylglutaryl-CoA reductase
MVSPHIISGFSRLSREEKLEVLSRQGRLSRKSLEVIRSHQHSDPELQQLYGEISENNLTNFFLPMGLAPNFLVNGDLYAVPMVIEESSVVAAASNAAKFWAMHGGFRCRVSGVVKTGQVHFTWSGREDELLNTFQQNRERILSDLEPLTGRMAGRGGGIESMEIRKISELPADNYQLFVTFRTADAMGANFINSVLEQMAQELRSALNRPEKTGNLEIIMAILSNYTPECLVTCTAEAECSAFDEPGGGLTGAEFASKFVRAVEIANTDPYRAVTHNKGIFNGMDAVIMATGNDYRAVEACGHAYASRDGKYRSLSRATLEKGMFRLSLEVPLAVGTVGGLTGTHPMAAVALEILGSPDAEKLMQIIASAGLASNFSAVRSLITTGIQKGHMKMHLTNLLRQLKATETEARQVIQYFEDRSVSHAAVSAYLDQLRKRDE